MRARPCPTMPDCARLCPTAPDRNRPVGVCRGSGSATCRNDKEGLRNTYNAQREADRHIPKDGAIHEVSLRLSLDITLFSTCIYIIVYVSFKNYFSTFLPKYSCQGATTSLRHTLSYWGSFNNYVTRKSGIFDPLPPLVTLRNKWVPPSPLVT